MSTLAIISMFLFFIIIIINSSKKFNDYIAEKKAANPGYKEHKALYFGMYVCVALIILALLIYFDIG